RGRTRVSIIATTAMHQPRLMRRSSFGKMSRNADHGRISLRCSRPYMRTTFLQYRGFSEGLRRPLVWLACALVSLTVSAQAAEPSVKSPVEPDESLQHFVLSPELDLRIDLVAAEPQVIDPVAVAFDEQARMYVVEMLDYPNGPAEGQPPMS